MTIKSAPYYYAECDNCGKRAVYHDDEITAWEQPHAAAYEAIALDWTEKAGRFHCPACPPLDLDDSETAAPAVTS